MEKNDPLIPNIDNNSMQNDSQNKDPNETIISNSQNSIRNVNNYKNTQFSKLEEYEEGKKVKKWVNEEDKNLKQLVEQFGEKNWRQISQCMKNRTPIQCLHRWTKILKPGLVKGPWSPEEDQKLIQWINQVGAQKWSQCSDQIPGRSGKQCRERWFNNLNPDVKKGNWTQAEDDYIFQGYLLYGSSWSKIAKQLVGRTENSVKNRFYSTVRKLLSDSQFKQLKQKSKNDQKDKDIFKDILKKHIKQNIDQSDSQISSQELGQSQEQQYSTYQNNDNKNDEDQNSKLKSIEQVKIENQESQNDLKEVNINNQSESEQNPQSFLTKRKYSKKNQIDYGSQNLLYRLLKEKDVKIKKTSCMKDYSLFYKKYKKNKKDDKEKEKYQQQLSINQNLFQNPEQNTINGLQSNIVQPQYRLLNIDNNFNKKNYYDDKNEKQLSQLNQINEKIIENPQLINDYQDNILNDQNKNEFIKILQQCFNEMIVQVSEQFQKNAIQPILRQLQHNNQNFIQQLSIQQQIIQQLFNEQFSQFQQQQFTILNCQLSSLFTFLESQIYSNSNQQDIIKNSYLKMEEQHLGDNQVLEKGLKSSQNNQNSQLQDFFFKLNTGIPQLYQQQQFGSFYNPLQEQNIQKFDFQLKNQTINNLDVLQNSPQIDLKLQNYNISQNKDIDLNDNNNGFNIQKIVNDQDQMNILRFIEENNTNDRNQYQLSQLNVENQKSVSLSIENNNTQSSQSNKLSFTKVKKQQEPNQNQNQLQQQPQNFLNKTNDCKTITRELQNNLKSLKQLQDQDGKNINDEIRNPQIMQLLTKINTLEGMLINTKSQLTELNNIQNTNQNQNQKQNLNNCNKSNSNINLQQYQQGNISSNFIQQNKLDNNPQNLSLNSVQNQNINSDDQSFK